MFKKILASLITVVFVLVLTKLSFAQSCGMHGSHEQMAQVEHSGHTEEATTATQATAAVNVGNKICPVSGDKIDEKTKATYEYQGKIYNFCCPMCIDEFKKDPQKYIKKVEAELKGETGKQTTEEPMHQGHNY